jgi:hypothetical protein
VRLCVVVEQRPATRTKLDSCQLAGAAEGPVAVAASRWATTGADDC